MLKAKEDAEGSPPKKWFSTHLQILALKALNRRSGREKQWRPTLRSRFLPSSCLRPRE